MVGRGDDVALVTLLWMAERPAVGSLRASVRLVDAAGRTVAQDDQELVSAGRLAPVDLWCPGEEHRTYHLFDHPAETGPLLTRVVMDEAESGQPVAAPIELGEVP